MLRCQNVVPKSPALGHQGRHGPCPGVRAHIGRHDATETHGRCLFSAWPSGKITHRLRGQTDPGPRPPATCYNTERPLSVYDWKMGVALLV